MGLFVRFSLLLICVQVAFASTAHAYLDPGTGSFIFQAVVAALVGASVTLKMYWAQVKAYLGRKSHDTQDTNESDPGESS